MPLSSDRTRGRAATEAAILRAARGLLAERGFSGLGVNALARRAGCDKQLIYRHFGGLEGLIDRVGADLTGWVERALVPLDALGRLESYAELVERLLIGYLQALRDDPVMQRVVAWELSDPSPMVRRLGEARSRGLSAWVARQRGDLAPPAGLDAPAVNALLIAAVQHVVLAAGISGSFAGLALASEEEWDRLRGAMRLVVRRVLAPAEPPA